jgi:hypothetical protein
MSETLVAWNVNYERTVLRGRGLHIPIERWLDPMVHARYAGLPGRLKDVAKIPLVGVPAEEKTKSETLLINRFCMPNKEGRRVMPSEYPEDWAKFTEYCRKDVQTMRHVLNWLTPGSRSPTVNESFGSSTRRLTRGVCPWMSRWPDMPKSSSGPSGRRERQAASGIDGVGE